MNDQGYDGEDHQDVNESSSHVKGEPSQQPNYKQDEEQYEEHGYKPLRRPNANCGDHWVQ
jgi:hypothetical protein